MYAMVKVGRANEKMEKMAKLGFNESEVKALERVKPDLIEKVASAVDQPWTLGGPSGNLTKEAQDPLLAFILG